MRQQQSNNSFDLNSLAVVGISFRQTPLARRGILALDTDRRKAFYVRMGLHGLPFGMVLSTCNRTEIYTDLSSIATVLEIWSALTGENIQAEKSLFLHIGRKTVNHLYRVMTGADSQIPGDMQITAQVKAAFVEAQQAGMSTGLFERIINNAIHCSRKVKSETDLTSGASSVPSAVVLAIKQEFGLPVEKKIAIIGLGKMGALSCQNVLKITESEVVTILNRTDARAYTFARKSGTRYMPFSAMPEVVRNADIVIVSTASQAAILHEQHLDDGRSRLIFDLSVPHNVDPGVAHLPGIKLVNLDQLSAVAREHIQYRVDQLGVVQQIINREVQATFQWWQKRMRFKRGHRQLHTKRQAQAS